MQSEVSVDGVLNFREVAGLATSDGRRLRSGLLYRSGSYAAITKTGVGQLAALGITQVVDLRNLRERAAFGFDRIEAAGVLVAGIRHSLELGELAAIRSKPNAARSRRLRRSTTCVIPKAASWPTPVLVMPA